MRSSHVLLKAGHLSAQAADSISARSPHLGGGLRVVRGGGHRRPTATVNSSRRIHGGLASRLIRGDLHAQSYAAAARFGPSHVAMAGMYRHYPPVSLPLRLRTDVRPGHGGTSDCGFNSTLPNGSAHRMACPKHRANLQQSPCLISVLCSRSLVKPPARPLASRARFLSPFPPAPCPRSFRAHPWPSTSNTPLLSSSRF